MLGAWVSSDKLLLYTDASSTIGYAAVFRSKWFAVRWHKLMLLVFLLKLGLSFLLPKNQIEIIYQQNCFFFPHISSFEQNIVIHT